MDVEEQDGQRQELMGLQLEELLPLRSACLGKFQCTTERAKLTGQGKRVNRRPEGLMPGTEQSLYSEAELQPRVLHTV